MRFLSSRSNGGFTGYGCYSWTFDVYRTAYYRLFVLSEQFLSKQDYSSG